MSEKRKADDDIPSGKPTKSPRLEGQERSTSSDEQEPEFARQARREKRRQRLRRVIDSDDEDEKPSTASVPKPGEGMAAAAILQHEPAAGPKLESASKRKRAPVEKPQWRGTAGGPLPLVPEANKGNVTKAQDKPSKARQPAKKSRKPAAKPSLTFSEAMRDIGAKTAALKPEPSTTTTKDAKDNVHTTGSAPHRGTTSTSTKRKAYEAADLPVKKAKVEDLAAKQDGGSTLSKTSIGADRAPGQGKSASKASDRKKALKRSAEEDTASSPAKKTKVQGPPEATSENVRNLWAQDVRRGKTPDARKTSSASVAKEKDVHVEKKAVKDSSEKATVKHRSDKVADDKASSPQQEQTQSSRALPPAKMKNNKTYCFANVVLQTLDSVPEFREAMITKYQETKTAVREDASSKQHKSLGARLGLLFAEMEEAAGEGGIASAKSFLRAFGKRNKLFDGRSQQDVYECMEKLLQQLDEENIPAERTDTGEPGFAKGLFTGKTASRLSCKACGNQHNVAEVNPCSLQLRIPPAKGRKATISSCLEQCFATETPEGFACDKCGTKDTTTKQEVIQDWGKYLVLICDRAWKMGQKIGTKMPIPSHVSLGKHLVDNRLNATGTDGRPSPQHKFEVLAFAEHKGNTCQGGHYYITRRIGNRWFRCNDEEMYEVDKEKELAATVATLVLLRKE